MIITIGAFHAVKYLTRYVNSPLSPIFFIQVGTVRGAIDGEITNFAVVRLALASPRTVLTLSCPVRKRSFKRLSAQAPRKSTFLANVENPVQAVVHNYNDANMLISQPAPSITPQQSCIEFSSQALADKKGWMTRPNWHPRCSNQWGGTGCRTMARQISVNRPGRTRMPCSWAGGEKPPDTRLGMSFIDDVSRDSVESTTRLPRRATRRGSKRGRTPRMGLRSRAPVGANAR